MGLFNLLNYLVKIFIGDLFVNNTFITFYEKLNTLNESNADIQKLVRFAGQELADRFIKIKDRLPIKERDLYYWINHKTKDELEQRVLEIENIKSKNKQKQDAQVNAVLLKETDHWYIYRIDNYEASKYYGRDTQWCIAGISVDGLKHWNYYKRIGGRFYFLIAKQNYNPRGRDSKFAIMLNDKYNYYIIYDQQDHVCEFDEVPYFEEICLPEINLAKHTEEPPLEFICDKCGGLIIEDEAMEGPNYECYCLDCFEKDCFICADCFEIDYLINGHRVSDNEYYCRNCIKNK